MALLFKCNHEVSPFLGCGNDPAVYYSIKYVMEERVYADGVRINILNCTHRIVSKERHENQLLDINEGPGSVNYLPISLSKGFNIPSTYLYTFYVMSMGC